MAVVLSAVSAPALAGKKKDKKQKQQAEPTVVLASPSDSVSYAAGKSMTNGLIPFIRQQYGVDTAYMADFVKGYREAIARKGDPEFVAYIAGTQIAAQTTGRMIPGISREFEGTADTINAVMFHKGFTDALNHDDRLMADSTAQSFFSTRAKSDREAIEKAYREKNEAWLSDNATKSGVTVLPSGLQYRVITEGTGPKPVSTDEVRVVYEGRLIDGTVFDATKNHQGKKEDKFRCDQVIKGWTEALTMMPVGSKWEIFIPQSLAYGSRQAGQIKPYSTLIFTVELLGIEPKPAAKEPAKEEVKPAKTSAAKAQAKPAAKKAKASRK